MTIDKTELGRLKEWGGPALMGDFEAVMWRAEVDPRLRSSGTSLHVLDSTPDWDRVYEGHKWVVNSIARFRQKVVEPALDIGNPMWVDDPGFRLDYHLRRVRVAAPGTRRQMLDFLQEFAATPCDRARPPWEALLIEGLEDGTAVYALKLHHAMTDGMGLVQLFDAVLSNSPDPTARPQILQQSRPAPSPWDLTRSRLRRRALRLPLSVVGGAFALSRKAVSAARQGDKLLPYLGSAQRSLASHGATPSPLFRKRSLSMRYDMLDISLKDLKAAGKAAGCSLNDALLSAIIGGFRRYHEAFGVDQPELGIGFPISLRGDGDDMGGNRFAGAQYAAPLAETDPVVRMRQIGEFVQAARAEPAVDFSVRLMPLMNRLPLSVLTSLTAKYTTGLDVQISNIPGASEPVYIGGSKATHHYAFGPRPGSAVMIAMFSYCGRCCLGINSDPAAVIEPELLLQSLQEEFDLVCNAHKSASARRVS